jgi:hypothetical protein
MFAAFLLDLPRGEYHVHRAASCPEAALTFGQYVEANDVLDKPVQNDTG